MIGNTIGCSSAGCRTMVTIEEESIQGTSNHQGEAQANPFWEHPNQRYHLTMENLLLLHYI